MRSGRSAGLGGKGSGPDMGSGMGLGRGAMGTEGGRNIDHAFVGWRRVVDRRRKTGMMCIVEVEEREGDAWEI